MGSGGNDLNFPIALRKKPPKSPDSWEVTRRKPPKSPFTGGLNVCLIKKSILRRKQNPPPVKGDKRGFSSYLLPKTQPDKREAVFYLPPVKGDKRGFS